jgi:ribonuclease HI
MYSYDDLFEIAYKKEKTAGRRLAKANALSEEEALQVVLKAVAEETPLNDLIARRKQEKVDAAAKVAARKQLKADIRQKKLKAAQVDPTAWLAWFDGASHPNPGKMGIGGLLKDPSGKTSNISFAAGLGDSSEAEYIALIAVLEAAIHARADKLVIYGDSQVVINDVQTKNGGAAVLSAQRQQAQKLITQLKDVTLTWIPREKNTMADALSQQAVKMIAAAPM